MLIALDLPEFLWEQAVAHAVLRADYAYLSSTYVDKDQYEGQYLPGAVG